MTDMSDLYYTQKKSDWNYDYGKETECNETRMFKVLYLLRYSVNGVLYHGRIAFAGSDSSVFITLS